MLSSTATGMLAIILSTQVSAALVAFALLSVFLAFSCRTIIGGNESAMNLGEMKVFSATFRERGANLSEHLACELRRTPSRNCLKSLGGTRNAGPQGAQTIPFGPFWPQYTGQISAWSVTRTPFQTVSRRSSTSEEAYSAQWGEKALARAPRSRTSATLGIQLPALKTLPHVSPGGMYQLGVDEDLLYLGLG